MTEWAERREHVSLELDYFRQQSALVACPECSAPVGRSCRNVNDGGPLAKLPHKLRMEAAGCLP